MDPDYVGGARVFHTTGITMAISDTARSAAFRGLEVAHGRGVTTSFDVNYRRKLWMRVEDAVNVLSKALSFVDIVFLDEEEANLLLGVSAVDDVFRELRSRFGIDKIVLKLGLKGSMAYWEVGSLRPMHLGSL